jgi:hypothetical protein
VKWLAKQPLRQAFNLKIMIRITLLLLACLYASLARANGPGDNIVVTKIWDQAKHNAFPDLIKFGDYLYCTLREGANHVGNENNGQVRMIRSKDGKNWESVGLFEMDKEDVREARLSITPQGTIMAIVAAGIFKDGRYLTLDPYVSFSDKSGLNFSKPQKTTFGPGITPTLDWIWRVTWDKGIGYGIMYSIDYRMEGNQRIRTMQAQLLRTTDGKHFEHVSKLDSSGSPNESTIRFDKSGKMYVMVRRETEDQMGVMAVSNFPYTSWNYHKMSIRLGGPNFQFLGKNSLIMGSRLHEGKAATTALHVTDLNGKILKSIKLPSGGDNSYPGLVMDKKQLWVAYYSSHEGKSNIYLTKISLKDLR